MAMTETRKGLGPLATNGKVPVYDADAHIAEPPSVWEEYADPKFRDQIMQCRIMDDGTDAAFAEGKKLRNGIAPACIPHAYGTKVTWDDIVPGSYDPAARLSVMDDEGLAAALMFPSLMLISGDINDPEIAVENARAYNRWMTDFVSEDPNRLFGVGVCPLQSVDGAVAVIEEVANAGLTGVTFRPERYGGLELFSPDMDRVWSAAEHHDLTVAIHGSFGSGMPSFAKTRYENQFYVHMVCHPFEQMASVMEMVASGVLDDHPMLRVGFFESGLGWLPYWLDRLDEHKEASRPHGRYSRQLRLGDAELRQDPLREPVNRPHSGLRPHGVPSVRADGLGDGDGGVWCARRPSDAANVGFFESGLGWLPYWLDRLDEGWRYQATDAGLAFLDIKEAMGHLVPRLKRDPTEIFSEQCFVTMEAGEGEAFEQVAAMGLAHVACTRSIGSSYGARTTRTTTAPCRPAHSPSSTRPSKAGLRRRGQQPEPERDLGTRSSTPTHAASWAWRT